MLNGVRLPKPILAVLAACLILAVVELTAQFRSHFKFGQSLLTRTTDVSTYVRDEGTGLTLLRPNHTSGGSEQTVRSNSFGLRSPDIALLKPLETFRIVVLGASTVMGAYAVDNDRTFPAFLQQELARVAPNLHAEVINAGVVGFDLRQQAQLFDRLLARFKPDLTIVYPGTNDFARYCRMSEGVERMRPQPLISVSLPNWLLSVELLLKNTVALRDVPTGTSRVLDASSLDLTVYRESLSHLFKILQRHKAPVLIVTNVRSYRPEQPLAEQETLSTTARFYNSCFDLQGLHVLYDRHNAAIESVAGNFGVPVFHLDEVVPGGKAYFVDASHLSERGNRLVGTWLADQLAGSETLRQGRR